MEALYEIELFENSLLRWSIALVTALAVLIALLVVKRMVVARLAKLAERTSTRLDDVLVRSLERTRTITIVAVALSAGERTLDVPVEVDTWFGRGLIVVLAVQAGLWATGAVKTLVAARSGGADEQPGHKTMSAAVGFVTNLVVWSVLVLVVLSNFGVEVTTLVAGLGVGGVAAALAVQNVLGDLFAAFSIYVDRPFDIGDFIIVDEYVGNVERIGWRSTQLRSLGGETIVFANSDLSRARIRNYKRMQERRIVVQFGVEYGTPAAKLEAIPAMVKETIEGIEGLRFDRSHFKGYGAYSLDFETVFYVLSPEYAFYMDRQQRLLLTIYRRFEQEGIAFAFPTQTLHLARDGKRANERDAAAPDDGDQRRSR